MRIALPPGRRVIVACSGGVDSLALAAATAFECRGRPGGLITVDHGLQPGSDVQAKAVADLAYELGFDPVEIIRVDVGTHGGPEAAARTARYAALDAAAAALDADVLLGHTLDDQAETVLLGLGRGSGPRSIAGMRPVDGPYRRPLLGVRRATTEQACQALGLIPWDDPHNADPSYQRVRLRREVLPLLEDVLQGGVAAALARTAALTRDDVDALDDLAADHLARALDRPEPGAPSGVINSPPAGETASSMAVDHLDGLPRAIRTRVLRGWAHAHGTAPLTTKHTAALDALITDWNGQGPVDLPGGFQAVRASGRLTLRPRGSAANPKE
ncbi:MAG TPA: tRNA lysidine(34) synthetase TilS [Jatrophihabitantaceae bacterium]